ncbi:MAG: type II toxin-antitoxin system HigB family toxin [Candidatus Sumerlaeia bacterium]
MDFAKKHPSALPSLKRFARILKVARWGGLDDVRGTFPHADQVKVRSGNLVTVFNLGGNNWRVVAALHFNRQIAYILAVLTHPEYSKDKWKETL